MQLKNKKFIVINLGCRANAYETNCISSDFTACGAIKVNSIKDADICLINTCSVTNKADSKSKYFINKVLRENKNVLLVVMGCFSQTNPDYFKHFKNTIVIGNKYKNKVVDLIKKYKKKSIIKVENFSNITKFEKFNNISFIDNTRAFLKIQDGCNYMCSYCIIPFSRGRQRSLDHKIVLDEIKELSKSHKEIVLTGINTAGYLDDSKVNFFNLLKKINEIKGDFRIRISSIEPFQINHQIIDLIANNPRFCQHIHLCLQSGSNQVLHSMNRKYTTDEFYSLVKYIRSKNKNISITTDYIVGFNNETDELFNESLKFLSKAKFSNMHIFPYSPRKYTAANRIENPVNESAKTNRFKIVNEINNKCTNEYLKQFINKSVNVLFEKPKQKNVQTGHSEYFFKVNVNTCKPLHNQILKIKITQVVNNNVFGIIK